MNPNIIALTMRTVVCLVRPKCQLMAIMALSAWAYLHGLGSLHALEMQQVPIPGELTVRFKPEASVEQAAALLADYGLAFRQGQPTRCQPPGGIVEVMPGHEPYWIDVFQRQPLVAEVGRRFIEIPKDKYIEAEARIRPPGRVHTKLSPEQLQQAVIVFFENRYQAKDGNVELAKKARLRVRLQISHLRSEVIAASRYWERLSVMAIVLPDPNTPDSSLEILLIVDGQYATGLGPRQPAESSYQPMQANYYQLLDLYAQTLVTDLQRHLEGLP